MKKLIFTIAIGLVGMSTYAQETFPNLPLESKVIIDSTSKQELYNNFLVWVGRNFNSPEKVIQTQNIESGVIILRFILKSNPVETNQYHTYCKLEFQCKDNKYRLLLTETRYITPMVNLTYQDYQQVIIKNKLGKKRVAKYLTSINNEFKSYSESLEFHLKTKPTLSKNDDW